MSHGNLSVPSKYTWAVALTALCLFLNRGTGSRLSFRGGVRMVTRGIFSWSCQGGSLYGSAIAKDYYELIKPLLPLYPMLISVKIRVHKFDNSKSKET